MAGIVTICRALFVVEAGVVKDLFLRSSLGLAMSAVALGMSAYSSRNSWSMAKPGVSDFCLDLKYPLSRTAWPVWRSVERAGLCLEAPWGWQA